ncbi:PREDICTED: plexin-A1-like, partial [Priapulus caudatus]|uniref:Plexin-A1-like n=1 Tax=Priapulus caudatus TaxID=37621 RepID=A0ABM1F1Y6_PRICU
MFEYATGPASAAAADCAPDAIACDDRKGVPVDNVNKVLAIDGNASVLLACGSAGLGVCTAHHLPNVSHARAMDAAHVPNLVGGAGSVVAFFAPAAYPPYDGRDVLYAGATYDDRAEERLPATVSSRQLRYGDESIRLDYAVDKATTLSYIDMLGEYRASYEILYVYGFSNKNFSYFLTVQRVNLTSDIFESRLARVCQNDPTYFSYTEVPLECKRNGIDYQVAQAGFLGKAGVVLARDMPGVRAGDAILTIVFARSEQGSAVVAPQYGSAVCVFSLAEVEQKFYDAVQDCYLGAGAMLHWFVGSQSRCTRADVDIEEAMCGSGLNYAIEGRDLISANPDVVFANELVTAVATMVQRQTHGGVLDGHRRHYQ